MLSLAATCGAHDLERTRVTLTFARDGTFVIDVANDPSWLKLRLESIPGSFADRVVLWVDGREVRPSSVEYVPPPAARSDEDRPALAIYRLRGRMPMDAHTLRWYYGLVIDPYPMTIRRADQRLIVEEVGGDAWSRAIDLSGQFHAPLLSERLVVMLLAGLLIVPAVFRIAAALRRRRRTTTKDTMDQRWVDPAAECTNF